MKRLAAILGVLAVAALLLLLLLLPRNGCDPGAGPPPPPAEATGPAVPPAPAPAAGPPPPAAAAPSRPAPPAVAPVEAGIRGWAPHGRVVNRATGEQVFWTALTYEVRFKVTEDSDLSWSEERDPPAEGDEPPKDPGAFDLAPEVLQSRMEPHAAPERVAAAEFQVRARAPGFAKGSTDWLRWADFPRDRDLLVEVEAVAPSSLLARVRTGEGAPFRGRAHLALGDEGEMQFTGPVEADAEGALFFENLPPGPFLVAVEPEGPPDGSAFHLPGDGSGSKEIRLPPGGRAEADFVLARVGEIAVDVAALDGSPVEAWVVSYQSRQGSGSGGASPRRLTGCPPGEYEVKVWSKGFQEWTTTVRVDVGATARVEARLERSPWAETLKEVPAEVLAWLDRTAEDLARGDSLVAARLAIGRAVRGDVWDHLVAALGAGDRGETARAEIRQAWANREKGAARTTSYGAGTFVVVAPPTGAPKSDVTPEEWWKGASPEDRKAWLLSWCAERFGLVEVVDVRDDPCPACAAPADRLPEGRPAPGKPSGSCATCHGARVVRSVLWR